MQTIRRVFQIRTCSRRLPARRPAMRIPCERLAQGLCPAPCADLVTTAQYDVLVDLALLFVAAGKEATLEAIGRRLEALEAEAARRGTSGSGRSWPSAGAGCCGCARSTAPSPVGLEGAAW